MGLFRRRKDPDRPDSRDSLYVHLAADGAVFVIRGWTGEQLWTGRDGLRTELEETQRRGGMVLYSRDDPEGDASAEVMEILKSIPDFKLPVQLQAEPHPEAMVAPEKRRTLTR